MPLRRVVSQRWLKKGSLVRISLVTPCMVIKKSQYQPRPQGFSARPLSSYLLWRQYWIPGSMPWNLGARSSQRFPGSRSEHTTRVARLCASRWSPYGTGVRDGVNTLQYSKHRMQKCWNMATLKKFGTWQH